MKIKLSSGDWVQLSGLVIYDPDGWNTSGDNFNADWAKPITFDEFEQKVLVSTIAGYNIDSMKERVAENFKNFL